jgi:long-chain fatty acid transport protein
MKLKKIAVLVAIAAGSAPVLATNGMNMEGYGPVATGMGGAAMAYDHGTAGMINNPATIGFLPSGTSRLDVAIGGLHPKITTSAGPMSVDSGGKEYYMPAIGYTRKDGPLAWGIGMMAQGGMGTEYGSTSLMSGYSSMTGASQGMTGQNQRSELGIGRIMLPISYDVSNSLKLAGSLDFLWGGLDMQMGMSGQMFGQMMQAGNVGGTMLQGLGGLMNAGLGGACPAAGSPALGGACINDVNWAQFDFSQGTNKMKQRATTTGWAGNIGFTWQANPKLSIGGVYHAKTHLKDMEGDATVTMNVRAGAGNGAPGTGQDISMPITGKIKIVNFQWPETYGIGMAYQVNDALMIASDYKRIRWSRVMDAFRMTFVADSGMFAGADMSATLTQNWKDQDVFMIGAAYKVSAPLTVRVGVNLANNPIPDGLMNPLFPATVKDHYAFGLGYELSKASSMDFAYTYAPKVSVTNASNPAMPITTTHAQTHNWQLMYSQRF